VISIGVAQIANSLEVEKNFQSILAFLNRFKSERVDLDVFPECNLSGFSAKMKECTSDLLQLYLDQVQQWSADSGVQANFAFNDLGGHTGAGPEGLSMVVNADNNLVFQASHLRESGFVVKLEKWNNKTDVLECWELKNQETIV